MNKFQNFVIKHKYSVIVGVFFLICLIVMIIALKNLLFSSSGTIYGKRLAGIEDVPITEAVTIQVVENAMSSEKVESAKLSINGKIVKVFIDFKQDVTLDDAKVVAAKTLTVFNEKEQKFYDFQYYLTQNTVEESDIFPTMGYKHHSSASIVWIKE